MSELSINFSQGESVKANSQLQQKSEQLKKLLDSFKNLGESSKSAVNGDLFKDINHMTKSLDSILQPNQQSSNSHQSFMDLSQQTLEFFVKHEHEMLFEQFEELNDFAKKRKKKPSMQEFITASLQNVGIWTLNTNKTPEPKIQDTKESNSSNMNQKGKRSFDSVYNNAKKDKSCTGSLEYIPSEHIPRLPQNNLGEVLAFSIAKDISFESFDSISSGATISTPPELSASTPSIMATDMSVEEIYDAITALLNKVILTEDDIFKLLQLLSEGGLQLIGIMPSTEIQDIVNTIDDSISDIGQKSDSIENVMALMALIQQFAGTDIGQLANIPLIETQLTDNTSAEFSSIQPTAQLHIQPLYTEASETSIVQPRIETERADALDEQIAGSQLTKKQASIEFKSSSEFNELDTDKVSSVKELGSVILKLSESKQEVFADKMLEMLIHVMSNKLDSVLSDSLDAFDNLADSFLLNPLVIK